MARKRMIDPIIWEDEDFGIMNSEAKLLFIGLFSNADDEGRIRANPSYLKSTIFMYEDTMTLSRIAEMRDVVCKRMKNVKYYVHDGKEYIQLLKWSDYQKQHKDRIQESTLPPYIEGVSDIVGQVTDIVGVDKVSIVKDKLSKVKLGESKAFSSIEEISQDVIQEISDKYRVPVNLVELQHEQLKNYILSTRKSYKNYKAALSNWVLREAQRMVTQTKQRGGYIDATNV